MKCFFNEETIRNLKTTLTLNDIGSGRGRRQRRGVIPRGRLHVTHVTVGSAGCHGDGGIAREVDHIGAVQAAATGNDGVARVADDTLHVNA